MSARGLALPSLSFRRKDAIVKLSGIVGMPRDAAITQLVKERKLIVEIQQARVPDIKKLVSRKAKDW
jgi:hypothetical protein